MQAAIVELVPPFERATGHKVTVSYDPSGGLAQRLRKGEFADMILVASSELDKLIEAAKACRNLWERGPRACGRKLLDWGSRYPEKIRHQSRHPKSSARIFVGRRQTEFLETSFDPPEIRQSKACDRAIVLP